jgi:hypothetical protein
MRRRRINIEGGRYLVFYTFDDEPELSAPPRDSETAATSAAREADAARDSRDAGQSSSESSSSQPALSSAEESPVSAQPAEESRHV